MEITQVFKRLFAKSSKWQETEETHPAVSFSSSAAESAENHGLYPILDHTHLTEHAKKMGSLTQCPITFVFLHKPLPDFCVYADYITGYYILLRKLCCCGNKLATTLERGTLTTST